MIRCVATASIVCVIGASSVSADILSHWRFDEAGGTTAFDTAGGAGVNGTLTNGAAFRPGMGITGGAIETSIAANSYVNMGNNFDFGPGDAFSIQVWVKTAPGETTPIFPVARHDTGQNRGYLFQINANAGYGRPNRACFYTSDAAGQEANATTAVNDGQWHQIVGTFQPGGSTIIYVDGAPAEATVAAGPLVHNNAPFMVGGLLQNGTLRGYYTGLVDDVQVYCGVLTSAQVQYLFDNPGSEIPRCPANWNRDCGVNSQDFFDFIAAFFAGTADFNMDGMSTSQDFFDFVTAFFTPC